MPSLNVVIDAKQLADLKRKTARGGLFVHQEPLQQLFKDGSQLMFNEAKRRAPVGTGQTMTLMRDLYGNTGKKPWGIGRVGNITKQGAILNNGGRGRLSRYRQGPRKGRLTRNWLSGVIRLAAVRRGIDSLVRKAVVEMGNRWERG